MIEGNPHLSLCRTVLAQPYQPLQGSTASRKLDVAIVDESKTAPGHTSYWSRILIPGELKSNPELDTASRTWHDLGRYVREVFTAQDTRRFVLDFTLCGSLMRLWEFDRAGATASESFDINKDGSRFVSVIVGYLFNGLQTARIWPQASYALRMGNASLIFYATNSLNASF